MTDGQRKPHELDPALFLGVPAAFELTRIRELLEQQVASQSPVQEPPKAQEPPKVQRIDLEAELRAAEQEIQAERAARLDAARHLANAILASQIPRTRSSSPSAVLWQVFLAVMSGLVLLLIILLFLAGTG